MPLLNGREVKLIPHPTDIVASSKVFEIRFTGEIFKTYEEYSVRLDFYRRPKFSCKYTGKSGFNFESAISHENQTKSQISSQIPSEYLPIIFKEIQFSQLKLTDLVNKIYEKLLTEFNEQNEEKEKNPENTNNSNDKKPVKKTSKPFFKKTLIRTQIRCAANQQNFKNAPWILNDEIAEKYNISTEIPQNLQLLITQYLKNRNNRNNPNKNKKKKEKKPKDKKQKDKKQKDKKEKSKSVKPETLISSLTIKTTTKSLKYPCDDQLLLMYDKMDNHKLIQFDKFWKNIQKIGIENNYNQNDDDNNYSNLAFIDFNTIYDGNDDEDIDMIDNETKLMKHRQINDLFNEVWNLWSFVDVYYDKIGLTPFPISFLMDALCYDKRSILLDELQCVLLEIIRKHCISTIAQRIQQKKDEKLKKKIARKKQRKANKRKQLKRLQQKKKMEQQEAKKKKKRSDKEEMDAPSDDEEDEEEEEEEEDDSEVTESEEEESSEEEEEETESELESEELTESDEDDDDEDDDDDDDEDDDYIDIMEPECNTAIFTEEAITGFRLDLLREYLGFRCKSQEIEKNKMEIDEKDEEEEDEDEDIDIIKEDEKSEEKEKEKEGEEEQEALLPEFEYSLNDEIWDKLSNIRSYVTLPIESKLEIIGILFQDVMSTNIMNDLINEQIERYQDIKQDIKLLDDEYSNMIKEEKNELKHIRNELIDKKRILNPKKKEKPNKSKKKTAASSSSSSASCSASSASSVSSSSSPSKSKSNSPNKENKENNSTKANSKSSSIKSIEIEMKPKYTSRQQELLRQKEEKEKEELKQEIEKLDNSLKSARNLMNEKCKLKELEITYKKFQLLIQCRTYLMELGSDRFHNKYFWSLYSDGRIFIFHPNSIYHEYQLSNKQNDTFSICKEIIKSNNINNMKCYNEWELNMDKNQFCWSLISTSTQFYNLLNILDERGVRESQLLLTLNALKNDIIGSMKIIGNHDYKQPIIVDETDNDTKQYQLRRSKRATTGITKNIYNDHIQSSNKGFLSYRNKMKKK